MRHYSLNFDELGISNRSPFSSKNFLFSMKKPIMVNGKNPREILLENATSRILPSISSKNRSFEFISHQKKIKSAPKAAYLGEIFLEGNSLLAEKIKKTPLKKKEKKMVFQERKIEKKTVLPLISPFKKQEKKVPLEIHEKSKIKKKLGQKLKFKKKTEVLKEKPPKPEPEFSLKIVQSEV